MKRLFFCVLMISIFSKSFGNPLLLKPKQSYSDTTVLPQILNLPLQNFIGKAVDSLLIALPNGYDKRGFMPAKIGYIKGVYQVYGTTENNHCSIEIYIDTFNYLTVPNYTAAKNWNMTLAKQETIAFIRIRKNNICIYKCDNSKYN